MRLRVEPAAIKALRRMPAKVARSISARMKHIAIDPFAHNASVKALTGTKERFRLRVGRWRALYRIDRDAQEVVVVDVFKREEAYR